MEIKYDTCQNCKGNGYIRIAMYEETQTCKECGGAGYFKPISIKNGTGPTNNHPLNSKVDHGRKD